MVPFLELLPTLSFETLNEAILVAKTVDIKNINEQTLRHWAFMVRQDFQKKKF